MLVVGASHSGSDIAYEAASTAPGRPLGQRHRATAGPDREPAWPVPVPRPLLRRHARPDRRHAARPQDAFAHPARRRAAPPLQAKGSSRCRRRAGARANGWGRSRSARARRRASPRRQERRLVHRLPSRLLLDQRSRSSSARTATRCSTEAPSRRRRACTWSGCPSCTRSRRCSSEAQAETPNASCRRSSRSRPRRRHQRPADVRSRRSPKSVWRRDPPTQRTAARLERSRVETAAAREPGATAGGDEGRAGHAPERWGAWRPGRALEIERRGVSSPRCRGVSSLETVQDPGRLARLVARR